MKKGQLFVGSAIILIGLVVLLGMIFNINIGIFFCPMVLIILGAWLLLRPVLAGSAAHAEFRLIGESRREGDWQVTNEEFWMGIGNIELDLTNARIPDGETYLRFYGFVGDVSLRIPKDLAYSISVSSFVADAHILDYHRESVFTAIDMQSQGYASAAQKLKIELMYFVTDLKLKTPSLP